MNKTERTGLMQDLVNKHLNRGVHEPLAYAVQGDALHMITPVTGTYVMNTGDTATPDELVVSTWIVMNGHASRQPDHTMPNAIPAVDRRYGQAYAQALLGMVKEQLATQQAVEQAGVTLGGPVNLTDPSTLHVLRAGWSQAVDHGVRAAATDVPDIVRLSYLQDQARSANGVPMTWALEDNGRDLHVITFHVTQERASVDMAHYQYELVDGRPTAELIHIVNDRYIDLQDVTADYLMEQSANVLDWYQRNGRFPEQSIPRSMGWQPPSYAQADVLPHGGAAQLTYHDQPVPAWHDLQRRSALAWMAGTHLDLRHSNAAQTNNQPTNQKGSIMVDQLDTDTHRIVELIDNDQSLNAIVENYAIGLEATQPQTESQVQTNAGVAAVADNIVQLAVRQLNKENTDKGFEPDTFGDETLASARQEVTARIMEYAQFKREERLDKAAPAQIPQQDAPKHKDQSFPKVNVPPQFVHPYQLTAKDGRVFDKAIVNIPAGTRINGIDVTGYSFDRFMNKRMQDDKINNRPVTVTFAPDKPVAIFRGKGADKESINIDNAWDLCKAIKAEREEYKHAHQQAAAQQTPQQQTAAPQQEPQQIPVPEQEPLPPEMDEPYMQPDEPAGIAAGSESFFQGLENKTSDKLSAQAGPQNTPRHEHAKAMR